MAVTATPERVIERWAGLRVLVVGEAMLDSYLHGATDRLCRCGFQGLVNGKIVFEGVVVGMPLRGA